MRRSLELLLCLLIAAQACGDDEGPAADGGAEHDRDHDKGKGGSGGSGGKAGKGGSGGKGGSAGLHAEPDGGSAATQAVTIRFRAKVGDQDLECGKLYADQGKTALKATPQDFRFFVQQVSLITTAGKEVPIEFDARAPFQTKDVALIDFTDRAGACSAGGATVNTTITGRVPAGDYAGIAFVNGVPESLNHENITSAKPPLQDPSAYWGWASGYRFIMAGLTLDPTQLPADPAAADGGVASPNRVNIVHIGAVGCSGAPTTGFTCARPNRNKIVLKSFDAAKDTIIADLAKVFADVDLSRAVECHGPGPECAAPFAALGVGMDSGAALDDQSVFRVE